MTTPFCLYSVQNRNEEQTIWDNIIKQLEYFFKNYYFLESDRIIYNIINVKNNYYNLKVKYFKYLF